jgi:microcystin-dependent protein
MATNNAVNTSLAGQSGTGQFVGNNSPTITTPRIVTQVNDTNGNAVLGITATASAVNYINLANAALSGVPTFSCLGTDTNIDMAFQSKGSGSFSFASTNSTPFGISSGTAYQHRTNFSFANTSATRTVTFQDASGTLAYLSDITSGGNPVGTIIDFAGTSLPTNYLQCDGSAVSRTTYATLFAAIGTTWGVGDGSTTFNLPNFNRRTAVGSGGTGTGTLGNAVGNTGGAETVTLTLTESPAHQHVPNTGTNFMATGGVGFASGAYLALQQATNTNSQGGGGAHNNIQPSAIVLKCIKYQ